MEQIGLLGLFGLCAIDDIETKTVRVIQIGIFALAGIIYRAVSGCTDKASIFGGVLIGVVMYLIAIVTDEKIGKGDALIVMVTGLFLGFSKTMELLWLASVLAGAMGLYILFLRKEEKSYEIPFVPFLFSAYAIIIITNEMMGAFV